jgi:yeast amino acid transporter
LLAIILNGVLAISVMECVSEFTQLFPAPNAIVEIVAAFVDEDLAWVVGIAYWYIDSDIRELLTLRLTSDTRYTYASIFANQLVEAAGLSSYWGLATIWQILGFYFLAPIVIIGINLCGVKVSLFSVIHNSSQGIDNLVVWLY